VLAAAIEDVQQMVEEFAASTGEAQKLLTNLQANIITPAE